MPDKLLERWDCMEDGKTYLIFQDQNRPDRIYIRDYHAELPLHSIECDDRFSKSDGIDNLKIRIQYDDWKLDLGWCHGEVSVCLCDEPGGLAIHWWFSALPSGVSYYDFMREFPDPRSVSGAYFKSSYSHLSYEDFMKTYLEIAKTELKQKAIEFLQEGIYAIKEIE